MKRLTMLAAACALVFAGAAAAAGEKNANEGQMNADAAKTEAAPPLASYSDQAFFEKAAVGGMAEVDAGKLANTKGESDDVRSFGQKMIDDHTKKNQELKALAAKKNVALPTTLDAKHQQMVTKLGSLSGDAFDRAYSDDMVKGHAEMVALLEQAANESKDPEVRMFASDTLKAVHQHHELAMKMQKTEMAEATDD